VNHEVMEMMIRHVSMRCERDQRKFVAQCLRALIVFLKLLIPAMENWVNRPRHARVAAIETAAVLIL
jgi:hypothetical protein